MQIFLQVVLPLVAIFFVKVLENMLDATKIIFLQKGKHVLSGIVLIVAVLINYNIMKKIVASGPEIMIVAACGAGIGYMIAGYVGDRFMRSNHIEVIMSDDRDAIREIHNFLTTKHIKHKVEDTYNKDLTEKTLTITAFPNTQAKHVMIRKFLTDSKTKFGHVVVQ